MSIVQVALDVPLPRLFDYLLDIGAAPEIGRCVSVPFGSGQKIGLILGITRSSDQPSEKLKQVSQVLDNFPLLPKDWLALCEFCARYYQHPLGEVVHFALPPLLRRGKLPRAVKDKRTTIETASPKPRLLPEQQAAVDAIIAARGFETFLLHGITGSGKTEVYLHAIDALLQAGKQALMLVPEIALTPQLEQRVAARFPSARIVSAHSGVANAARSRAFLDALEGRADIVLGTRLAVFMPLPRLGLIVIDEEHDGSFKQQEGLRYSARDVAIFRAKQMNVPIVLGSATPALETFHHARSGRYRLLELSQRAVAESLPTVSTIDTRREKLQGGMSQALLNAIRTRLERHEQSLIFLNRRGYAPVLACPACGWISHCRRCAANLVLHLVDKRLRCHHCGIEAGIPHHCPDCGNLDIHPFGRGTQRLEQSLGEHFPTARILRVDRDSADSPKKWRALLDTIHAGDAEIIVGTQMLAKGHDFPKLTLVGVVGADTALFAADFRAPERLFSQLMQVGGRSGRAELHGQVLIQTEYPDHPLYRALADHDYARFAAAQLKEREQAGFPPFTHQAMLRADAPAMAQSIAFLEQARSVANEKANTAPAINIYDPVPMRLSRLANRERAQLLVESPNRPLLQNFLAAWTRTIRVLKTPRDLRWHVDVDPMEF
ncbi:Primosomal protein N' [Georgfuchsia toluolica]|uniref:Replication restart protein PriA n=1 Tax=Georgfuchsia toluolica TaxID=424218 RepID=A0A916N0J5_9PROT|nr:primosomal protein N' [Georgfuchsia toluolica]CAG4884003.1 Primosomal protein N' [Georgfuchsia toluolica]